MTEEMAGEPARPAHEGRVRLIHPGALARPDPESSCDLGLGDDGSQLLRDPIHSESQRGGHDSHRLWKARVPKDFFLGNGCSKGRRAATDADPAQDFGPEAGDVHRPAHLDDAIAGPGAEKSQDESVEDQPGVQAATGDADALLDGEPIWASGPPALGGENK